MSSQPIECPNCQTCVETSVKRCPNCGLVFFPAANKDLFTGSPRWDTALGVVIGLFTIFFAPGIAMGILRYSVYASFISLGCLVLPICGYLMLRTSRPAFSKGLYYSLMTLLIIAGVGIAIAIGLFVICLIRAAGLSRMNH